MVYTHQPVDDNGCQGKYNFTSQSNRVPRPHSPPAIAAAEQPDKAIMTRTASQVLEQEFLQVRAKILEIAAFFDRLSEAPESPINEQQLGLLRSGCKILDDEQSDKAARVQLLFSRQYDENWREKFGL